MAIEMKMEVDHVGEFIKSEIIDELGLSIARAAKILGVRAATLSDLLNSKAALSTEMAVRLEKAFGVRARLLLGMQTTYDLQQIERRADTIKVERYAA